MDLNDKMVTKIVLQVHYMYSWTVLEEARLIHCPTYDQASQKEPKVGPREYNVSY